MAETKLYLVIEFDDGLQVIPHNWLNSDMKKAFWPRYTNNKRYDRAVIEMEEPDSTWLEYPVRKIFGTFSCYEKAKKKLKDAEHFSEINSDTELDEYLKTSRKIRAAKVMSDSSSADELREMDEFVKDMPKIPEEKQTTHSNETRKGSVNVICAQRQREINKHELIKENVQLCSEKMANKDSQLQHCKSVSRSNVMRDFEQKSKKNVQESQKNEFLSDASNIQTLHQNENYNEKLPSTNTQGAADPYVGFENFHRFVIGKLITIETKINLIENHQRLILQKLSVTNILDPEEKEIDIFQDLLLKSETELQAVETKLSNDSMYRKQMIKQLARVVCQDIKISSIRLMKQIFSNELAMKYSWHGAKKKEIFSDLQLCKIIMRVIRHSHANVTDDQISGPIKIWLAHAKERAEKQK